MIATTAPDSPDYGSDLQRAEVEDQVPKNRRGGSGPSVSSQGFGSADGDRFSPRTSLDNPVFGVVSVGFLKSGQPRPEAYSAPAGAP
jgi:hypothetical protein